jgi:hypothetical protein
MKAQMQNLGGPLTWVAMHTLFILILQPKNCIFKNIYFFIYIYIYIFFREINQVLFILML